MQEELNLLHLTSYNSGSINVKIKSNRSVLEEIFYFNMLGSSFALKLDWGLLYYLYCWECLQENWGLDSFYEVCFFGGCCLSLKIPMHPRCIDNPLSLEGDCYPKWFSGIVHGMQDCISFLFFSFEILWFDFSENSEFL